MSVESQSKQPEWFEQWSMIQDNELFLFKDWIYPNEIEDFSGKESLECGCGGGQHTYFVAPYSSHHTAVDLNTVEIARVRNQKFKNVTFEEADIAKMDLGKTFDIVFSIGVVHHTDDPDATMKNLSRHVKPGGRLMVWVYSKEGNWAIDWIVEPFRKLFLKNRSRRFVYFVSSVLTAFLYPIVYSVYLLPLPFLPYYEYFQNFRRMSFGRNNLNVFDKLNAPQVQLITRERATSWLNPVEFEDTHISPYKGVSWRVSGTKKATAGA